MIVLKFIKSHIVLAVAAVAALVTSFMVPIDSAYIGYFDFKTLCCLFCVLAVVCALKHTGFFYSLAYRIVKLLKNVRASVLGIVWITFLGSMLIANDMALLTFLPLGFLILDSAGKRKYMAFTFVMQNIAANLGGMLTPFGNPQNLYLYTKFSIPTAEFVRIMAPPFVFAVILITVCCLFVPAEPLGIPGEAPRVDVGHTAVYLVLFALSIAIVFHGIPYLAGLAVIVAVLLFLDRKALAEVDYPLLLTFVFFFVFAGNMSRIGAVNGFLSSLLEKNTLIFSILSCQLISNVPSAILLSRFTGNYADLLVGVNIGGVGTLISSMASLITFGEYVRHNPGRGGHYMGIFSALNFGFLVIMTLFMTAYKTLTGM
ncbi:MAG: SLC13 family permease [Eubacteriales bacterium]